MIKIDLKRYRREVVGGVIVLLLLIGGISVFKYTSFNSGFEIVDDLGGNIFPSAILSVATTDAQVILLRILPVSEIRNRASPFG